MGPTEWQSTFGDKTSDGRPVSLRKRLLKLSAQAITFTVDTKVLGGYVLNDVYALVYEGRNGAGWIVRGCALGVIDDGKWVYLRSNDIAIPPG